MAKTNRRAHRTTALRPATRTSCTLDLHKLPPHFTLAFSSGVAPAPRSRKPCTHCGARCARRSPSRARRAFFRCHRARRGIAPLPGGIAASPVRVPGDVAEVRARADVTTEDRIMKSIADQFCFALSSSVVAIILLAAPTTGSNAIAGSISILPAGHWKSILVKSD